MYFLFILEHYDTACVKQQCTEDKRQKSIVEFAKMKKVMQQFVAQPDCAADATGSCNVDYDSDRDADIDFHVNASME